eukprot:1178295-Prorocentrum_minimum.AAC.3
MPVRGPIRRERGEAATNLLRGEPLDGDAGVGAEAAHIPFHTLRLLRPQPHHQPIGGPVVPVAVLRGQLRLPNPPEPHQHQLRDARRRLVVAQVEAVVHPLHHPLPAAHADESVVRIYPHLLRLIGPL